MGTANTLGKALSSKTVWAGIGIILATAAELLPIVAPYVPPGGKLAAIVTILLALCTIYGRIQARQSLGPVIDKTIADTVEAVHVLGITKSEDVPATVAGRVAQVAEVKQLVAAIATEKL